MTDTKVSLPLFIIFLILDYKYQNIKASDICICGILSKLAKAPMSRTSVFKNVFVQQGNKGNVGIVAISFSSYESSGSLQVSSWTSFQHPDVT